MLEYAVDIPNGSDPEGEWVNLGYFETREEAIAYAREALGADEDGRIGLVSELPPDPLDEEEDA
jgi:hypothetical protein